MAVVLWLARENLLLDPPAGPHEYSLSPEKPYPQDLGTTRVWESKEPEAQHRINAELWHCAGGLRLKPGGGPVRITLTVTCTEAPGEEAQGGAAQAG